MAQFAFHHIHLRTPDPEKTAAFYERMFGAEVIRSTQQGKPRVDVKLGGASIFLLPTAPGEAAPAPMAPNLGIDHFGLGVTGIDGVVEDLKAKGAAFTVEPYDIRPGVRIAFLRGPENVLIELVDASGGR
jgi:catechol 2,3-dioxygenase-like lactoylglutathione lyase family enzyme